MIIRLFSTQRPKRAVFLGSPSFAADTLKTLHAKSKLYNFDLVAIVTQPCCSINGPTPVEKLSRKLGLPEVLTPTTPRDVEFLNRIKDLKPDICLTAAYGGFLPRSFLEIPPMGVYNIHPSLLPLYRGAAPVQRCLEDGHKETGVTILKTVLKMDAGPVVAVQNIQLDGTETADILTNNLFKMGTQMFLDSCADIFRDTAVLKPQDESRVTFAPKISPEESIVDFGALTAQQVFNRFRGFSEKPGIKAVFSREAGAQKKSKCGPARGSAPHTTGKDDSLESLVAPEYVQFEVKLNAVGLLLTGNGAAEASSANSSEGDRIPVRYVVPNPQTPHPAIPEPLTSPYFEVTCFDGSKLAVTVLQPSTRRTMTAKEFHNGNRKEPFFL